MSKILTYDDYHTDPETGVWCQKDRIVTVDYGDVYFAKGGRDTLTFLERSIKLCELRVDFIEKFADKNSRILDVGCGLGTFVMSARKRGYPAWGYDKYIYRLSSTIPLDRGEALAIRWDIVTFYDTLEHFPELKDAVAFMEYASWVVISHPLCWYPEAKTWFMDWHHRKPGEHFWHFTRNSLVSFMKGLGFDLTERSTYEDIVRGKIFGPTNILTSIFRKKGKR